MKEKYRNLLTEKQKHVVKKPVRIPKTDIILDESDEVFLKDNSLDFVNYNLLTIKNDYEDEAKIVLDLNKVDYEIRDYSDRIEFEVNLCTNTDIENFQNVLNHFKMKNIFYNLEIISREITLENSVLIDEIIFEAGDTIIIKEPKEQKKKLIKQGKEKYVSVTDLELPVKNESLKIKKNSHIELSNEEKWREKNSEKIFGKKTQEQIEIDLQRKKLEKGLPKIDNKGHFSRFKWEKD